MKVELLYFDGCPNHEVLLPRLEQLLASEGVEGLELRRVESPAAAVREHFLGSPTVRVNGEDVESGAADRSDYGLMCRIYQTKDGPVHSPPDKWIKEALRRAR